ncbi:MAG: response regulator transcription factor [Acidobacteria bacterium]|nr:response regulator transcription factor [Acidobacteriota bacterium]
MRVAVKSPTGLKVLYTLGSRLGLIDSVVEKAVPADTGSDSPARYKSADAAGVPASTDNGYPFRELQHSFSLSKFYAGLFDPVEKQEESEQPPQQVSPPEEAGVVAAELPAEQPRQPPAEPSPDCEPAFEFEFGRLTTGADRRAPEPAQPRAHEEASELVFDLDRLAISNRPPGLQELAGALSIHGQPHPPASLHTVLSRKKIAVIGFPSEQEAWLSQTFEAQFSVPYPVSQQEAVEKWTELCQADLLLVHAPLEWEVTEPIDPGYLSRIDKPALVCGSRNLLTRLAQVSQVGLRDYQPLPCPAEEIAWRAATLIRRPQVAQLQRASRTTRREKPEILIADDDVTTRTLLSSLLSKYGMVCHVADNGGHALDIIRTIRPDAVVMDITMTSMDGFQVLAAVRQDPTLSQMRALLLTSRSAEVDKLQAFALGADDYVTKPFSPMELAARLKRLLRREP